MESEFLTNYLDDISNLLTNRRQDIIPNLIDVRHVISEVQKRNRKIIIVGNGASASISSHFSIDLTKAAGIRCVNFNEANLITCFSNDYGYESWVEKAIEYYGDKDDVLIAISSSGNSDNILNGCKAAKRMEFDSVITFSGFDKNNPLRKCGDINLWVNSKEYNYVENIHQIWLLAIVDLISANTQKASS